MKFSEITEIVGTFAIIKFWKKVNGVFYFERLIPTNQIFYTYIRAFRAYIICIYKIYLCQYMLAIAGQQTAGPNGLTFF